MTISQKHTNKIDLEQTTAAEKFQFAQISEIGKEIRYGTVTPFDGNANTLEELVLLLLTVRPLLMLVVSSDVAEIGIYAVTKGKPQAKRSQFLVDVALFQQLQITSTKRRGTNSCNQ